jgi:xanthine/uracil permease
LATLARYIGVRRMRRVFSPAFSGALMVLLALSLLPRIFSFAYYEPLLASGGPAYKYVLVAVAAFVGYFITTSLSKKVGQQPASAILIGLAGGVAMGLLLDAVELLWISKSLDETLMIGFMNASFFAETAPTPLHNLEAYFGFWQYLHFDWESLLLFVPLVLVTVSEHMASLTRYALAAPNPEESPHADKTILIEGVAVLVGGMVSGVPLTFNEDTVAIGTRLPKARPLVLVLLALFTIGLSAYLPIARAFDLIPLPAVGGVLVAWAGYQAVRGFGRVTERIHDDLHPQATALAMVVLGAGILMTTMEFISDFLGNTSLRIMIGTTPIPSYLIIILLAFVLNLLFPRLVE